MCLQLFVVVARRFSPFLIVELPESVPRTRVVLDLESHHIACCTASGTSATHALRHLSTLPSCVVYSLELRKPYTRKVA